LRPEAVVSHDEQALVSLQNNSTANAEGGESMAVITEGG